MPSLLPDGTQQMLIASARFIGSHRSHQPLQVDLTDTKATSAAPRQADPATVTNLAGGSHMERSIDGRGAFKEINVLGTFQLLQALRRRWDWLPGESQAAFRFRHISTNKAFVSLGPSGRFSNTTRFDPRSPYSASNATSTHLVNA